ncbi:MAG: hypothetical protein KGM47_04465 [Acidobacteriota bacterium]|nr:hypothetical protein [Acidobacteriota bacterium]
MIFDANPRVLAPLEARRIATLAETYLLSVVCHNPIGSVTSAASASMAFATPNYQIRK